jgi:hypothetical protein
MITENIYFDRWKTLPFHRWIKDEVETCQKDEAPPKYINIFDDALKINLIKF